MQLINYLFPDMTAEQVKEKAARVDTSLDFQKEFMHGAIRRIIENSSSGLTYSGFENLEKGKAYLFIANHRDILLDAAILQVLLVEHGFETSEITFGSNLKQEGFITEFGRLNRMFTVDREGTNKELYEISRKLSAYIRHTLTSRNVSVWIAQRNGRTKDGNDTTQTGLLKMLNISGEADFARNFGAMNIVPLSISYEYEPCDDLKAQELFLSSVSKYQKQPGEDINSIVAGIKQFKGKIHLAVGTPLTEEDLQICSRGESDNERFRELAQVLDAKILEGYLLRASNYIAADLLSGTSEYQQHYSEAERAAFIEYCEQRLAPLKGDQEELRKLFYGIYATPVHNKKHL